jgi:hypothetical protein
MAPTAADAQLVVQLAQWGAMIGLEDALGTTFGDDFNPETADANDRGVRIVLYSSETVGTLVKNGLLDRTSFSLLPT